MRIIGMLLGSLVLSSLAYGSSLESCRFEGDLEVINSFELGTTKVTGNLSGVALYTVSSAVDAGSHDAGSCQRHVGQTVAFTVKDRVKYLGMKTAKVSYFSVTNFGPSGVMTATTYKIINLAASSDALEVDNLKTDRLNLMPGPGRILPTSSRLLFDATVVSTGCTKADDFEASIVENEDGEQVLSIKRTQPDFCEVTPHEVVISLEASGFDFSRAEILYNGEVKPVAVYVVH